MTSQGGHCVAVDLGASNGRVIVGSLAGRSLKLTEVHRFPNRFNSVGRHDYWDLPGIWAELRAGLLKAQRAFTRIDSIGVDTWGIDHALVDARGRLVFPAHAYRDRRTRSGLMRLGARGLDRIYARTGIPNLFYNTSLQLEETLRSYPKVKWTADRCLFLSDYFNFLLSGKMVTELSIASTSQLLEVNGMGWSKEALAHFGIPRRWFSHPLKAGARLGPVRGIPELRETQVILVPGHDTACAFDAVPSDPDGGDVFLSSGTWSLVGYESPVPLCDDRCQGARISNERTGNGLYRPLTNVVGMWLLERTLSDFGMVSPKESVWARIIAAAERKPTPSMLLSLGDASFVNPASMRGAIDAHLLKKGMKPPPDLAGYVRIICESIGEGHAKAIRKLEALSGRPFKRVLLVGGGARNRLLCQATANAARLPIVAFDFEASALGNLARQFIALDWVKDLASFRRDYGGKMGRRTFSPH